MRFGTAAGGQLDVAWMMRDVALGQVLKAVGYLKMHGRNADFASWFMTNVWFCVAKAKGYDARSQSR